MHSQIAHDADLAAGFILTFPIDWFGGIEIAAVMKTGMDF